MRGPPVSKLCLLLAFDLRMGEGMKAENLPLRKPSGIWSDRVVVDAVAGFRREYRRWPSAGAPDPQEGSLGIWLSRQRIELANGRLDEFLTSSTAATRTSPGNGVSPSGLACSAAWPRPASSAKTGKGGWTATAPAGGSHRARTPEASR
jgi:hypothetical protein